MFQNRLDQKEKFPRHFSIMLDKEEIEVSPTRIKVIGVGGGGCNAINSMIDRGLTGVEFIAINTDEQSLSVCKASKKLQIGSSLTHGKGTGGNPNVGESAAIKDKAAIEEFLKGAEMIFIASTFGGGTGTGASPVVAAMAQQTDAIVVGIITLPFEFEGKPRAQIAEQGKKKIEEMVDCLITIPNQKLIQLFGKNNTTISEAFNKPNEILYNAVKGITDFVSKTGYVNIDFADVRTVMKGGGDALIGIGREKGENKALEAVQQAITSPLQDNIEIRGARNVLVNFTASNDLSTEDFNAAMQLVDSTVGNGSYKKFGIVFDNNLQDEVIVTLIATGFGTAKHLRRNESLELIKNFTSVENIEAPKITELNVEGTYEPSQQEIFDEPTFERIKKKIQPVDEEKEKESFIQSIYEKEKDDQQNLSKFLRKLMD